MDLQKAEELNFQARLEQFTQLHAMQRELIKSVGTLGTNALRGIFVLNSGGAIAILAHTDALKNIAGGANSVKYFALGAFLSVISAGAGYISELFASWYFQHLTNAAVTQTEITEKNELCYRKVAFVFLIIAVGCWIASCVMFIVQLIGLDALFRKC